MAKYSKFTDQDYHVKTFRWPYWLLPLLFLSLILVLGLFIFITIHSADRFGCLFHCEQKIDDGGVVPPRDGIASRRDQNVTENPSTEKPPSTDFDEITMDTTESPTPTPIPTQRDQNKTESPRKEMISVKGKLLFPSSNAPDSIPPHSHLIVKLEDTSLQDAPSDVLAKTVIDVSNKKGTDLTYKIECAKPKNFHDFYNIAATLNMGWTPTKGDPWMKKGDFFTDTMFTFKIQKNVTEYERDVTFAYHSF